MKTRRARGIRKWAMVAMCATCFQAGGGCAVDAQNLLGQLLLSVGSTFITSYVNDLFNVPPTTGF